MKYDTKRPTMVNTSQGHGLIGGKADRHDYGAAPQLKGEAKAKQRRKESRVENALPKGA